MNKNIKKLAMEADFMLCEDGNFYSPTDSQYTPSECYLINAEISKFAELIIEQCAELVDNAPPAVVRFTPYLHKYFGITNEQTN